LAKPEWGTQRTCQSCGQRFYDFGRSPAVCPACGTALDVESLTRARRARPSVRSAVIDEEEVPIRREPSIEEEGAETADLGEEEEGAEVEETIETEEEVEEEDEGLIEDASELGEDEDMSDVIEGDIDEEPR
jgi:uncharacterized protein (TIGR02300 family)